MATITAERARFHPHSLPYMWQALIVVIVGSFMVMLYATVVNIALPRIITVFNAGVDTVQFVATGYMIALAIIMPATGYLSDTYGTKRIYLVSMFLFTLGSLLCGLSWDVTSLIFFRILQGLGGGMMMPLGMTIIFKTVPPEKLGLMSGIFGLPLVFAPVIGPTLGGYIVEYIDWRFIFTLNLPVGALGLFFGLALLRETTTLPNLHLDLRGFVLAGAGFSSVFYGLAEAPDWGWDAPKTLGFLGVGGLLLILWVIVELTEKQPLLELRVLANKTYALATGINFIVTLGLFSSMLLLPIFLQNYRGLGAMETGLLLFPQAVASGLMMPISGRLLDKVGPRPLIVVGLIALAYGSWRLGTLDVTTSDAALREILIIRGLAMGLVMMPAMTVAMSTLPPHLIARGSSLTNVLRQLFGAFGTAVFVTILQTRTTYHSAMLSQTMTPDLMGIRVTLGGVQQYILQHGGSLTQAKAAGLLSLYKMLVLRAAVLSFDDCFMIGAAICLFGVVPALFLNARLASRRPGMAGMRAPAPATASID
jgi:EmrB/QacA subfamily drug resistance transporter